MDTAVRQQHHSLHTRLERQLQAMLGISRRWRSYESDLRTALKAITETASDALAVDRASIWMLDDKRQSITCQDLYEQQLHRHARGYKLARYDHPEYFAALETEEVVVATDAETDPRTRSFRDGYLKPHGIGAMLDIPIRVGGRLTGVLCLEHVGRPRLFLADEQNTARFLANFASLACELQARADTETEVEESRALFSAAIESADIGVFAADLKGGIFFINDRAREFYDCPEEMLGPRADRMQRMQHFGAQMKHSETMSKGLMRVATNPSATLDKLMIELKNGRTLECSSRPQAVGGKIVGRVWTVRDITGSKKSPTP